jgi:hypothetical protein
MPLRLGHPKCSLQAGRWLRPDSSPTYSG